MGSTATVKERSQETLRRSEAIASASEEMSANISELTRSIENVRGYAEESVQITRNTVERVEALKATSREINNMTNLIEDISDKINVLSLNATIEAASAGEVGKSFAVGCRKN